MNIQTQVAMQVQAMVVGGALDQVAEAQANPVAASAPASAHADVILSLSTAAARLMSGGAAKS